jgi:CBS domain containing-hemolysin-like protein
VDVPLWELIAIALSLVGSFFFSATETSLTALSEARTRQLLEQSRAHRALTVWLKHPDRILTTLLFGNTLANIGASAVTTDIVARSGNDYAVAIATGGVTFVVLTFCEIIPKTVAKRYPVRVSQYVGPLVVLLYWLLFPITYLLLGLTKGLTSLFGLKAGSAHGPSVTGEEIEYLISLGSREGVLDDVKRQLLSSVLEFADLLVKEIMVPRTRIVCVHRGATLDEVMKVLSESEHSRIPVYEESIDNVVGVIYVKDLARDVQKGLLSPATFKLDKYLRTPLFVPELMKISRLLREFQKSHMHLAVVVDEFGGTSGVVSLEDVVEEIVGEIQDETDFEERSIKALADGRFVADGTAPLREVEQALSVEFPEDGDYETLGGFLTSRSGKVPPTGAQVVWKGLTFTIRLADDRRVSKVEISKPKPEGGEPKPAAVESKGA